LRATLVAALCWLRQREVTDSLVDRLIQVIHTIGVPAEADARGPSAGAGITLRAEATPGISPGGAR
jgi:hypothetical protein